MNNVNERMKKLRWNVVKTTMTIHDVPFRDNPQEVIPTEHELEVMRNGFDSWLKQQGKGL